MMGKLTAIVGPMGSGKTKQLIDLYTFLTENGSNVVVFKPYLDTRGQLNLISSRDGMSIPAEPVKSLEEVVEIVSNSSCNVVMIDEIQFFGEGACEVLEELLFLNVDVYVFGLDVTSENETFGEMGEILSHADEVIKLKTKCVKCGNIARISHYNGDDKNTAIKIGDLDVYEPLCRDCYNKEMSKKYSKLRKNMQIYRDMGIYHATIDMGTCTVVVSFDLKTLEEAGYTLEQVQDINSQQGLFNFIEDLNKVGEHDG